MRDTTTRITILKGLSSTIKPGRLTLLLGPPSSGKTTLLKALSGKLRKGELDVKGQVTFNGYGFDECVVGRTSVYVDQVDNHIAELTVRETLDFAARVQGAGFGAFPALFPIPCHVLLRIESASSCPQVTDVVLLEHLIMPLILM